MARLLALLLLSSTSVSDAITSYKNSQLIDLSDLQYANGVAFSCPGTGCTLYTTYQIVSGKDIGIFRDTTLLMTLDKVYSKYGGYLVGKHLEASTSYRVKNTTNYTPIESFQLYIVADIAGSGAVTEFSDSTALELDASGKDIVTILNTKLGLTFSKFIGKAAPKIYAAGFDSTGTCRPVYMASSVDNAAQSEISVYSGITTIDFGSTDYTNQYYVSTMLSTNYEYIHANPGGSAIVSTPGYNGCPNSPNFNNNNKQIKYKMSMLSISNINVTFDDMSVTVDNELTLNAGRYDAIGDIITIKGTGPQAYSFGSSTSEIDFIWQPMGNNDYFHAQVDVSQDGKSGANGGGSLIWLWVLLGIFGVFLLLACIYCAYRFYVRKNQKSREEILAQVMRPSDDGQYEEIHWTNANSATPVQIMTTQPLPPRYAPPVTYYSASPVQLANPGVVAPAPYSPPPPVPSIPPSTVTPVVADTTARVQFLNEFEVIKMRGQGGFGCVFEATNKYDNGVHIKQALGEVRAMALLEHPNIVRYNSTWMEQPPAGFQHSVDAELIRMMGLERRSLMNYDDDSIFIYIQMQPSNVLFTDGNTLKLCDLGIATERRDDDDTETAITRTSLGTALYMSPEQRSHSRYSSKSDVFTLGLILAELCVVMTPTVRSEIFNNFRSGEQCDFIKDERTVVFIQLLTRVDPKNRPTCREMLDHLFLA